MPSNQTANYALNQWSRTDQVRMEDFNADNAKIDAALKAEADARTAAVVGLAQSRNCQVYYTTYVGTGSAGSGAPNRMTFPAKPFFVRVAGSGTYDFTAIYGQTITTAKAASGKDDIMMLTWSGNTLIWYETSNYSADPGHQLNEKGETYYVFAVLDANS